MTAQRKTEGNRVEDDVEFAVMLREGRGHAECYDAFAPALYRYCWTLLGPGPGGQDAPGEGEEPGAAPDAAVHEAFLAAVELLDRLRDRADLRPWLFALARAACQRHGFAQRSPYGGLATVEKERPVVDVMLRLPPSHRELLELYLRHGLSATQIATMLGLDSDTAGELCRASVHRAIDVLAEKSPGPDRPGATQWALVDVAALMDVLPPPGPPKSLRERVLADCAAPDREQERRRCAVLMRPLGPDGFPLHRARGPIAGAAGPRERAEGSAGAADQAEGAGPVEEESTPMPSDRITTADTPARNGPEQVAELAPKADGALQESGERDGERRTRWAAPVIAGLATVAVVLVLWAAGVFLVSPPPGSIAQAPVPAPGSAEPTSTEVAGDQLPGRIPPPAADGPPAANAEGARDTGDVATEPSASASAPEPTPSRTDEEGGQDPGGEDSATAPPSGAAEVPPITPPEDEVPDPPDRPDRISWFLDDLLDLFGSGE
ncbi:DNA-directed RNA polymerase specialized sigma24 family protein [Spinactinospora alkalitolerans]|uniref:DNA-directed RNA polymerase specialized sigma24 family protein n=1 Tax=Spinactinospora alkalitolerans TaxID=687207 RepID=A0A852TSI8_9ACTN|nr:sigma-70 family RNA polymerase sigma factor [Spinactinospora alkalitolerans]NYE45822.1 DNA-directed RNA polymerase specialized sigma24 family protein [Spinactinospora alkalitolerans]